MHTDVAAVITELDAHRERFEGLCRSLTTAELALGVPRSTWLVRDFIAHLATIDDPVREMFRAMEEGSEQGIGRADAEGEPWDVDRWNEGRVQERRTRTVDELLAEAAQSRGRIREQMAQFSDAGLGRVLKFGGDGKRPPGEVPMLAYLRGWCKHDPMHALDMLRAMPERVTPDIERWFEDPVIAGYQRAMNG